jgi:hypothetical protein
MDAVGFSAVEFATGYCSSCERDVLTHSSFDDSGLEVRFCVHCDTPLDVEMTKGSALSAYGYDLIEAEGCGRPDCGGGRCGRS